MAAENGEDALDGVPIEGLHPEQLDALRNLCAYFVISYSDDSHANEAFRKALAGLTLSFAARDSRFRIRLGLKALRGDGNAKKNGPPPISVDELRRLRWEYIAARGRGLSSAEAKDEIGRRRGVSAKTIEGLLRSAARVGWD